MNMLLVAATFPTLVSSQLGSGCDWPLQGASWVTSPHPPRPSGT